MYIGGIGLVRADKNEMTDKIIKVNIYNYYCGKLVLICDMHLYESMGCCGN